MKAQVAAALAHDERTDRYLAIERWARNYTHQHSLVISIGRRASRYRRIEQAPFDRYFPILPPLQSTAIVASRERRKRTTVTRLAMPA
jgi:hypothetical protein